MNWDDAVEFSFEGQIKDAKVGMTQNMGGTGASSVVHIMEVM